MFKIITLFYLAIYELVKENWKIIMIWVLSSSSIYNYMTRKERYDYCYTQGYADGSSKVLDIWQRTNQGDTSNSNVVKHYNESLEKFLDNL